MRGLSRAHNLKMSYHRDEYLLTLVESFKTTPIQTGKSGHPFEYADEVIIALTVAQVHLSLSLRAVCSLAAQCAKLRGMDPDLIPSFNRLSERQASVTIERQSSRVIHSNGRILAVDSTLISLAITGSARALKRSMASSKAHARANIKRHGHLPGKPDRPLETTISRSKMANDWIKVTIISDLDTGEILSYSIAPGNVSDASKQCFDKAWNSLPADVIVNKVLADSAYDGRRIRQKIHDRGGIAIIKPPIIAQYQKPINDSAIWRNQTLDLIVEQGWAGWSEQSGYSRRALVETVMSRHKRAFPRGVSAREQSRKEAIIQAQIAILNDNLTPV